MALLDKGRLGKCLQGQCEDSSRHLLDKVIQLYLELDSSWADPGEMAEACPSLAI